MKSQKRKTQPSTNEEYRIEDFLKKMKTGEYIKDKRAILDMVRQKMIDNDPDYTNNKELIRYALQWDPSIFRSFSDLLKDDKETVKIAVSIEAANLQFASNRLRKDKDVVRIAVKSSNSSFAYADDTLQSDIDFIMTLDLFPNFVDIDSNFMDLMVFNITPNLIRKIGISQISRDDMMSGWGMYWAVGDEFRDFIFRCYILSMISPYFVNVENRQSLVNAIKNKTLTQNTNFTFDNFVNILVDYEDLNFPDILITKRIAKFLDIFLIKISTFISIETINKINRLINFRPTSFTNTSLQKDNSSVKIDPKTIDKSFGNMGFGFK